MKIKEIKIENFGKLSGYNKTFAPGVNAINEENGWGKSTLASFIKVMFFGFDGESKKAKAERERERFRPWQSGTYGGSIVFEIKGKEYRMNRTFGTKPIEDKFALYDNTTSLVSTDYSDKIGEEIFKLDAESFKRTVLINQNDVETGATDSINAKLGNLTGTTDDIENYEAVTEKFKKKLNAMSLTRVTGDLYKLKNDITTLDNEVRTIPNIEATASDKEVALSALREQLEDNKEKASAYGDELKEASKAAELLSKKEQYDGICERFTARETDFKQAESVFTNGIPEEADINKNIAEAKAIQEIKLKAAGYELTSDEKDYQKNKARFFVGGIHFDEIEANEKEAERISVKEKEYNALQFSEEEKADYDNFSKKFEGKGDIEEKASKLNSDLILANSTKAAIPGNEALLQSLNISKPKKESSLWLILLIIGIVAAGVGAVLIFTVSKLAGIITASVGAALIIAGILVKVLAKPTEDTISEDNPYEALKTKLENDKKAVLDTENAVRQFLDEFEITFDSRSAVDDLSDLKNEYRRYKSLLAKEEDQRDDNLLTEIRSGKEKLDAFLAPFADLFITETEYSAKFQRLRFDAEKYLGIEVKHRAYVDCVEEITTKEQPILDYIKSLGFAGGETDLISKLGDIKEKLNTYKRTNGEFKKIEAEKLEFESANNVTEIVAASPASGLRSVDEIQTLIRDNDAEKDEIISNINEYSNSLSEDLEKLDTLREKAEDLAEKEEAYKQLSKREELISKTKDILEKAKASFTGKYSNGVAKGFKKYYELVDGTTGNEYSFDANMNLMIEDHGEYKDLHSYSSGSQDKIGICFRMGLIEAMYPDEKPIIIMDDPFTNFDPKRIDGGKKVLDALKDDYQIIYLTCHESRMPS